MHRFVRHQGVHLPRAPIAAGSAPQVHGATAVSLCGTLCQSYHDAAALDPLTESAPSFRVPPFGHNAFSRVMCTAQCVAARSVQTLGILFDVWSLAVTGIEPDVARAFSLATEDGGAALNALLEERDFNPLVVGQVAALRVAVEFGGDGWNGDGALVYSEEQDEAVPCTANCRPYADTIGYKPAPQPQVEYGNASSSVAESCASQCSECPGLCRRWQPLVESDQRGNAVRQVQVTPHIGIKAKLYGQKEPPPPLADPGYDYLEEARLVLERMSASASNVTRLTAIRFFDQKLYIRGLVELAALEQFPDQSYEEQVMFIFGIGVAEQDATILAWREKLAADRIRPTTYIKRWGETIVRTAQPGSADVVEIRAADFEALARVMPHSEFPSGSACICTAYADFTDLFTLDRFGSRLRDLTLGPDEGAGGVGLFCNSTFVPPEQQIGCIPEERLRFATMSDLARECGQSRLWAGLHFTASVSAAETQCSGLGRLASDLTKKVRNGTTWGATWAEGQPRPICGAL